MPRTKELARSVLASTPATAAVRRVTNSRLPYRMRRSIYRATGRHVTRPTVFTYSGFDRPVKLHRGGAAAELYWLGSYEPPALEFFIAIARHSAVMLDIGARDGTYAIAAAATNPEAQVIAFEPEPIASVLLAQNLALNPDLNVEVHNVVLAAETGETSFYFNAGNSSLRADFRPNVPPTTVQAKRGDDIVGERGPVGLVKIDTEGAEPVVLNGLAATIDRDRPVIVSEVLIGRTEVGLEEFFDGRRYAPWRLTAAGPVREPRIKGDPDHRHDEIAFVPEEFDWRLIPPCQ